MANVSLLVTIIEILRKIARRVLGRPNPTPERQILKSLLAEADRVSSAVSGSIRLGNLRLRYIDIKKLAGQWNEIFVHKNLKFSTSSTQPRILDCGGNMGLATLYFKSLYPDARVTTFEADPAICKMCRDNLVANGHQDVEVIHAAVWIDKGEISFCCEGTDSGTLSQLVYDGVSGQRQTVPAIRLREYLEAEKVDLLKLDIEGAEFDVLADCAPVLANVSRIVVELHETDPNNRKTAAALDTLARAGFHFTMEALVPMSWRGVPMSVGDAFPGKRTAWVVMVYAWRD